MVNNREFIVCFQIKTNVILTRVVMEEYVRVPMTLMDLNVHVGRDTREKVVKVMDIETHLIRCFKGIP